MSDDLPMGWVVSEIGTVVEAFQTTDPKKFAEDSFTYVDIGSIDNQKQIISDPKKFLGKDAPSRARRVIKKGDTLFSTVRTYLKNIALVPKELDNCLTSTGICILRPSEYIDSRYLFNWVRSDQFVNSMSVAMDGTMYPAVNDSDVYSGEIPVAPLNEQQRIVDKLERIGDRNRTARNELNHIPKLIARYKQAVLAAACSGKLTEDWREKSNRQLVSLEDVVLSVTYGTSAKSSQEGIIPVLRMGNIQNGNLDWSNLVFTSDLEEIEKYKLVNGDVLFNRTNSPELVGKTAVYKGERPAIYAGYLIRIRCNDNLLPDYLNYCLNSPEGKDYCFQVKSDGVSQSNINAKKLAAFTFELPSLEEQKEIVRRVEKMFEKIDRMEQEYQKAAKLCDRLEQATLAKAFRGELVPQDPDDEPASVLLEQVKSQKEKGKKGK